MLLLRLSLCCCLAALASCSTEEKKPSFPPVSVTDYVVKEENIPVVYDFIGFAESIHPVEIRARVEGFLDEIAYPEGQLVHEGDLLFQLDPKQYQAEVERAKGDVAKQEALLANSKLTVNRLTPLYEQKAASKKDLDNAVASLHSYEASLQSANAQLLNAQINLGYTTIHSPITGYADKSRLRQGALVNPSSNSLLTTVSVLDPIWVYFSVSDNDILRAKTQEAKGLVLPENQKDMTVTPDNTWKVEAILSDGSVFPYDGIVNFSSPTFDQATGTLLVRAEFPNPEANLRPGQFVRVRLYGAARPNAIKVPLRALLQKKGGMFVYLIGEDGKAIAQDVGTGGWYGDYQIITEGLKAGDRVVVDGINRVRPGALVQITGPWNAAPKTPVSK